MDGVELNLEHPVVIGSEPEVTTQILSGYE